MSTSDDNIPWNMKPNNGTDCFFSEATYHHWIGDDSHESRLVNRLKKVNVNLSSKQPSDPWFLSSTNDPVTQSHGSNLHKSSSSSIDHSVRSESAAKDKIEILAEKLWSGVKSDSASGPVYGSDYINEDLLKKQCKASNDMPNEVTDCTNQQTTESSQVVNEMNRNIKLMVGASDGQIESMNVKKEISAGVDNTEAKRSFVKSGFFYKDSELVNKETSEHVESVSGNTVEQVVDHTCKPDENNIVDNSNIDNDKNAEQTDGGHKPSIDVSGDKKTENKPGKSNLYELDPMFYNIKDRKAEKYFPEIFKKKPKTRFSKLTSHEQRVYLELQQMYGKASLTDQDLVNENYHKFVKMTEMVSREQQLFQAYLRNMSRVCKADYQYIHPEVEKYVKARFLKKKKEAFTYPRYYNFISRFELKEDIPDSPPTLQYIRQLVKLGHVSKLVLPSILPGLPQPCVTTNYKKISEICPSVPKVYSGTYVWNNVVCSRDANAEQLAVPNKCDVVMSSSSVKHLVDNQGSLFRYWDMPFTVREYKLTEGDTETTHKVVYIDKPIIRQCQLVPKEQIQLYQKYAIKASAVRNNQRGAMFCGIKPVHEVVSNQTVEEVADKVKDYEEHLKKTFEAVSVHNEHEEGKGQKDLRKRKRKSVQLGKKTQGGMLEAEGVQVGKKTQGGMFEAEDYIDDLETFGMDSFVSPKSKDALSVKNSKVESELQEAKIDKTKSKCEKSTVDDLEVLRKELIGIKSLAMKETARKNGKEGNKMVPITMIEKDKFEKEDVLKPETSSQSSEFDPNIDNNAGDAIDITPESETKVLNVKNLSCLSEEIKQMSAIKTELEIMSKETSPTSAQKTNPSDLVVSNNHSQKTLGMEVDDSEHFDCGTATDSDDEGLVIDIPTDNCNTPSNDKKCAKTSNVKNSSHCTRQVKSNREANEAVGSDTPESTADPRGGSNDEKSNLESSNTRRKRQSTGRTLPEVKSPKRLLRSVSNKEDNSLSQPSRVTRSRSHRPEPETCGTADDAEVCTTQSPAVRGRKRAFSENRMTRSRSVSTEVESQHGVEKTYQKTSKHKVISTEDQSNIDSELEKSTLPQQQSLSSHKKKKMEIKQDSQEHIVDKTECNLTNLKESKDMVDEANDMEHDMSNSNLKTNDSATNSAVKLESEVGNKNTCEVKTIPKKSKRTSSVDNESKRIKEMARNMKLKIEERCAKEKTQIVETIIEDSQNMSNKQVQMKYEQCKEAKDTDKVSEGPQGSDNKNSELSKKAPSVSSWKQGDNSGIECVLGNVPVTRNKKSNAEVFAAEHGMSHCRYPVEDNVTYHQWKLAELNIVIRCKYHGFISGQGLVHLCPKMEYQPNFGYEHDTLNEVTRNWISVYTRPNSTLLKARINPFNSEIMMLEYIPYQELVPSNSEFSQAQAFTDLHVVLDKLKSLPVGEYVLRNNPRKDMFSVLKTTDNNTRGTFDLHYHHSSNMITDIPNSVQWSPLDTELMLPHQRKSHLIPCTYQPKDVQPGTKSAQKQTKRKGKKGKKQK